MNIKRCSSFVLFSCVLLTSCVLGPKFQYFDGGEKVRQSAISFTLPVKHRWAAIMRSSYQSAFAATDMPSEDTVIVGTTLYQLPDLEGKEAFLNLIQEGRKAEPETGRFETINNTEYLSDQRSETCVFYESASYDHGERAKRDGKASYFQMIGMHCMHPKNSKIGIQIELSRKSPPGAVYEGFVETGMKLLKSVEFEAF